MPTDTQRLDWLEEMHTLHQSVEIGYLVTDYSVEILWDHNLPPLAKFEGETLRAAIDAAMASKLRWRRNEDGVQVLEDLGRA